MGDGWFVLGSLAGCWCIDLDLPCLWCAIRSILTHVHILVATCAGEIVVVIAPGDCKATVVQGRYVGLVLAATGGFVDQELSARRCTVSVKALGIDTGAAAILVI